jgi:ketosteroid isomerase-like protein
MSATTDPGGPIAVVNRLTGAINAHDLDALVACFAADYRGETPATPDNNFTGREHVRQNWSMILKKIPDIEFEVLRSTTDGGTVWAEVEQRGTEADGQPHLARGVVIYEVRDGLMTHNKLYVFPVRAGRPGIITPDAG